MLRPLVPRSAVTSRGPRSQAAAGRSTPRGPPTAAAIISFPDVVPSRTRLVRPIATISSPAARAIGERCGILPISSATVIGGSLSLRVGRSARTGRTSGPKATLAYGGAGPASPQRGGSGGGSPAPHTPVFKVGIRDMLRRKGTRAVAFLRLITGEASPKHGKKK